MTVRIRVCKITCYSHSSNEQNCSFRISASPFRFCMLDVLSGFSDLRNCCHSLDYYVCQDWCGMSRNGKRSMWVFRYLLHIALFSFCISQDNSCSSYLRIWSTYKNKTRSLVTFNDSKKLTNYFPSKELLLKLLFFLSTIKFHERVN